MEFQKIIKLVLVIYIIFLIVLINYSMNDGYQEINHICKDSMIKYRSCDDLNLAKDFCVSAEKQFEENNCSEWVDLE